MCGRYSITLRAEAMRQIFQTYGELPNWPTYYNAAPTTALPVVRQAKDDGNRPKAMPVILTSNEETETWLTAACSKLVAAKDLCYFILRHTTLTPWIHATP